MKQRANLWAAALLIPTALAGAGEGRRCAIIASPECEQTGLGDLLTAKLSGTEGVELVERQLIKKVLAEHKLTAAGLASPHGAIQIGKLLAADAFLVVERVPKVAPPACRLQFVETRTGIALGMELLAEESLKKDVAPVARLLRSSAAKLGVPTEKRHYVGLLSFRSEEPGRALDGLAEALGMLLVTDLAASPGIVLLDREHLDALRKEEGLTGVELQLRTSALLIEGAIKRLPGGDKLAATVLLRPLAGGEPRRLAATVPEGNIGEARRLLVEAAAKAVGGAPPQLGTTKPEEEAAVFLGRVRCLTSLNDTREAVSAAEAALALQPGQGARLAAASAWQCRMWHLRDLASRPPESGVTLGTPAELKVQMARAHLRKLTLVLDALRCHVAKQDATEAADVRLPCDGIYFGELEPSAPPDEPALRELCDEAESLEEAIFHFQTTFYAKHYELCGGGYWLAWSRAFGGLHRGRPERQVELFRRAAEAFASPPGDKEKLVNCRLMHFGLWPQALQGLRPSRDLDAAGLRARALYVQLCRDLSGHEDPYIRLVGYAGMICMGEDEVASARAALDTFLRCFPEDHRWRNRENERMGFSFLLARATRVLAYQDPSALEPYCQRVIVPWIDKRDASRVLAFGSLLEDWLKALSRQSRFEQLDAIAAKAHEVLVKNPTAWRSDEATRLVRSLEQCRRECAEKLGRPAQDEAWADYTLRPLAPGLGDQPACLLLHGEKLICVHGPTRGNYKRDTLDVSVTLHNLPQGGPATQIGKTTIGSTKPGRTRVTSAALGGDTVYVGTGVGLIAFPLKGGKPRVITEADGLPSDEVLSVAFYEGRLYIGFGPVVGLFGRAAFGCLEADGSFRLIASASAAESRSGLDGGRSYNITAIAADPERKCLWLGVLSREGLGGRNGVWRYTPQTGKLEHTLPERFFVEGLAWSGKSLVCNVTHAGLVQIDPATLSRRWLAAGHVAFVPTGCEAKAVFGSPQVGLWPAALDGDRVITGGEQKRALYLLTKGSPPASLEKGPDGNLLWNTVHLLETPFGLLAATARGHAYLIARKGAPREGRRPKGAE